jgi:hypothetical protein
MYDSDGGCFPIQAEVMTDALTGQHSLPARGGSHVMLPHFVKPHC